MILGVVAVLALAMAGSGRIAAQTFCIDLSNGFADPLPSGSGASWISYTPVAGGCNDQGVLLLQPPSWALSLIIDESAVNSNGWTLNFGDSSSNNGWAVGDPVTPRTPYSAELQIRNGRFSVYKNNLPTCKAQLLAGSTGNVGNTRTSIITVEKYGVSVNSSPSFWGFTKVCDRCLYNWDDMYLGMNRVIRMTPFPSPSLPRTGTGLCRVCLTWSSSVLGLPCSG